MTSERGGGGGWAEIAASGATGAEYFFLGSVCAQWNIHSNMDAQNRYNAVFAAVLLVAAFKVTHRAQPGACRRAPVLLEAS